MFYFHFQCFFCLVVFHGMFFLRYDHFNFVKYLHLIQSIFIDSVNFLKKLRLSELWSQISQKYKNYKKDHWNSESCFLANVKKMSLERKNTGLKCYVIPNRLCYWEYWIVFSQTKRRYGRQRYVLGEKLSENNPLNKDVFLENSDLKHNC